MESIPPGGTPYKYLYPRPAAGCGGTRSDAEVLSLHVSTEDIEKGALAIRDEKANEFRLFATAKDFWRWAGTRPLEERCFHEVVFSGAQRLKFDIDASPEAVDRISSATLDSLVPGWDVSRPGSEYTAEELDRALSGILGGKDFGPGPEVAGPQPTDSKSVDSKPDLEVKAGAVLRYLLRLIVDVFEARYEGMVLPMTDLLVASSLGDHMPRVKFSYHVIIGPYMVANHFEAQAFTRAVLAELEAESPELYRAGFLDPDVNKSTQNFRIAGSQKPGSGRPKVFDEELAAMLGTRMVRDAEDTLIGKASEKTLLPKLEVEENGGPVVSALSDSDVAKALRLVAEGSPYSFRAHTYCRAIPGKSGMLLTFTRREASVCELCTRIHHKDHSLMVLIAPSDAGDGSTADVIELCRRSPQATRHLGTISCSAGAFIDSKESRPAAHVERALTRSAGTLQAQIGAIREGRRDPHQSCDQLFEQLPSAQKQIYAEPQMRPYEVVETLAVKAQMGMGKTRRLREYIDRCHPPPSAGDLSPPAVIRFVTFRQTFSESLREAFPDFKLYTDMQSSQISAAFAPRLIVQVESLHRLIWDAMSQMTPDLLILDEVESVLAQFSSGLHKSFNESFTVFQWLLGSAKRVICMDANLSDRTYRTLHRMRPAHPVYFHWNQHTRAADDIVHVTMHSGTWLDKFVALLQGGKKIAFASNSLREAKAVVHMLQTTFPDKKMKLYSSETARGEKILHFGDVAKYWSDYDVLAYTPTVSAGVSYERAHYDCMFVYLSDASCDVETARQMLGRVRQLADKEYYVCLRSLRSVSLPTDIATLEKLVYERRQMVKSRLFAPSDELPATTQYDASTGTIAPYRSPYLPLWLETTRIANLSRNNYARRFVDQVADTGARVVYLEADPDRVQESRDLAARKASSKEWLSAKKAHDIANAQELTSEEVSEIRRRASSAELSVNPGGSTEVREVTQGERDAVSKFFLRHRFNWRAEMLPAFVNVYNSMPIQKLYANLTLMLGQPTTEHALCELNHQERALVTARQAVSGQATGTAADLTKQLYLNAIENVDIRYQYRFPQFYFSVWFLRFCGFGSILDSSRIPKEWVEASLALVRPKVILHMTTILSEFSLRHPGHRALSSSAPAEFSRAILQVVNGALRSTFGVEVARNKADIYYLRRTAKGKTFVWPGDRDLNSGGVEQKPVLPTVLQPTHGAYPVTTSQPLNQELYQFVLWAYYRSYPELVTLQGIPDFIGDPPWEGDYYAEQEVPESSERRPVRELGPKMLSAHGPLQEGRRELFEYVSRMCHTK